VSRFVSRVTVGALIICAFVVSPVQAQLNTQHINGTVGLKAGSQPPPHVYVILPLVYVYKTDTIKDRNGNRLPLDANLTTV